MNAPASRAAAASGGRDASIRAAFRKLRDWLLGPAGEPVPVVRLAAVAALAALLVCLGGVRIYRQSRPQRMIEQQVERIVAGLYREPLLPGVESALLRTRPGISDYIMEDLSSGAGIWGEATGSRWRGASEKTR